MKFGKKLSLSVIMYTVFPVAKGLEQLGWPRSKVFSFKTRIYWTRDWITMYPTDNVLRALNKVGQVEELRWN